MASNSEAHRVDDVALQPGDDSEPTGKPNGIELQAVETGDNEPGAHANAAFDDTVPEKSSKPNGIDAEAEAGPLPTKKGMEEEEGEDLEIYSQFWIFTDSYTDGMKEFYDDNNKIIWAVIYTVLLILYIAYFICACIYDFEEAIVLVILTAIVLFCFMYAMVRDHAGGWIYEKIMEPVLKKVDEKWSYIKWPLYILLVIALIIILAFLTKDHPNQLISAAGLILLVFSTFVFSKSPRHVKWRPVLWGMALQFILGLFILRTKLGFTIFDFLGDLVNTFLDYTDAGAAFVFGDLFQNHYFAFKVLPIVIYFSSVVSVMYYLGVMQVCIVKIAWLMQKTMHTSAGESLNAAGNIFIGQTEAPLLIRPYIHKMTKSELHAIMTGGFATIAGGVFGAFVSFGISASHLLTASVMSAPAALAMAKLFYPEREVSKTQTAEHMELPKGEERNIIEAASNGASAAIPLVLNIAANLITFLALLALCNGLLGYFGGLVGCPELSFELICSYVFMPVAFMLGADWKDCRKVAELIGIKTFINEFVAYLRLADMIDNGEISKRSEVIATYACCGFANIGSIGIQLGGLSPLAPERKGDLANVALRALYAGTVACFMTACIAGVLYIPPEGPMEDVTTALMNATLVTSA